MNEPIGRLGSCRPLRLRRTALETAPTASSWSTIRWWMRSSITSSLARSVSIMRLTGMPVQALTTSAISSGPTSWRKSRRPPRRAAGACRPPPSCSRKLLPLHVQFVELLIIGLVDRHAGRLLFLDGGGEVVELQLHFVQLAADLVDVAQAALFQFPLLAEVGQLAAQLGHLLPGFPRAAGRRAPRSRRPTDGRPIRAAPAAAAPRRSRAARFPAPWPGGWRPRPSGRWPCRAGSGRRCSGGRGWPRPPGPSP